MLLLVEMYGVFVTDRHNERLDARGAKLELELTVWSNYKSSRHNILYVTLKWVD
jgi:hypothetical protein